MALDPLWRPERASYESFAEHLSRTAGFPTYLPWPLAPGWQVADFAAVGEPGRTRATLTASHGVNAVDGGVSMVVVTEEPGSGLGARVAGTVQSDPGAQIAGRPADARVKIGPATVPLWTISTHDASTELDRSVLAGEADGRWLWVVLWPASAVLLLASSWILSDASDIGPPLLDLPFGGTAPKW